MAKRKAKSFLFLLDWVLIDIYQYNRSGGAYLEKRMDVLGEFLLDAVRKDYCSPKNYKPSPLEEYNSEFINSRWPKPKEIHKKIVDVSSRMHFMELVIYHKDNPKRKRNEMRLMTLEYGLDLLTVQKPSDVWLVGLSVPFYVRDSAMDAYPRERTAKILEKLRMEHPENPKKKLPLCSRC
ncbi:MAG: hypothetical protein ABIB71_07120 [Candidatus Woesearchaeota archaeon]